MTINIDHPVFRCLGQFIFFSINFISFSNNDIKIQAITFSVDKNSVVSIKKVGDGEKAKRVLSGYKLMLENPTADTFTLVQSLTADGKAMDVRYNFVRKGK